MSAAERTARSAALVDELFDRLSRVARVLDRSDDLAAVADDPGVSEQALDVGLAEARYGIDIEVGERRSEGFALRLCRPSGIGPKTQARLKLCSSESPSRAFGESLARPRVFLSRQLADEKGQGGVDSAFAQAALGEAREALVDAKRGERNPHPSLDANEQTDEGAEENHGASDRSLCDSAFSFLPVSPL